MIVYCLELRPLDRWEAEDQVGTNNTVVSIGLGTTCKEKELHTSLSKLDEALKEMKLKRNSALQSLENSRGYGNNSIQLSNSIHT